MIPKEILQAHYKEYTSQSDEWVSNMEITKKSIVKEILENIKFKPKGNLVKVIVLGASDKRYLDIHERIFTYLLKNKVDITTLDIDKNHLSNNKNVVEHDVTKNFPIKANIIFSHELMKFLTKGEQLKTLKNSFDALLENGFAIHIIHEPSIKGTKELRNWQFRVDPDYLIKELKKLNVIARKIVFNSESDVDWLRETTVIILEKSSFS